MIDPGTLYQSGLGGKCVLLHLCRKTQIGEYQAMLDSEYGQDRLYTTTGGERVSRICLGRAKHRLGVAEDAHHGCAFGYIIIRGACTVYIDVADL